MNASSKFRGHIYIRSKAIHIQQETDKEKSKVNRRGKMLMN